jgi:hypothetical protein
MRFAQLEAFLKDANAFEASGRVAKRMSAAAEYLKKAFPKRCGSLRNRATVLSVCMLAGNLAEASVAKSTAPQFGQFVQQFLAKLSEEVEKGPKSRDIPLREYQEAISYGSTGGDSVRTRLSVLSEKLRAFNPAFANSVRGAALIANNDGGARELAHEVADLLFAANESAAAIDGDDAFKMTNKSTRALKRLGVACATQYRFGELADDLYFLVYEGSGSCKRLPSPPPDFAMDVKFLRTHLRHDLDHGDPKDAAGKRVRGASVLRKYLGVQVLETATEAQFRTAHLRLLEGLREMLKSL